MATNNASKTCEVDKDACKRQVRALCFHCSKNLCRIHLSEHTQLIEENTQTELHLLADKFNELSLKFNDLTISSDILAQPFAELEKWRLDSHEKIDQMAEMKCQEINGKIDEYRELFVINNNEHLEKISASKKMIVELIKDTDASTQQITSLQASIDMTGKYLSSLNTHKIGVVTHSPIWFVDICAQYFNTQPMSTDKLREFRITYIRLDGIIRHHYVKTNKGGTMNNLIKTFVRQYPLLDALQRVESDSNLVVNHQPKTDFVLPVEVQQHRFRLQFNSNTLLSAIGLGDVIVFYETSYSMEEKNSPWLLIPCYFRRLSNQSSFGWPVYLKVPRKECRGEHVRDSLHDALGTFFLVNAKSDQHLYDASFELVVDLKVKKTKLKDVLQNELDFSKRHTIVFVDIANQIADKYEQNI